MNKVKRELTDEELEQFWRDYNPPPTELDRVFLDALKRGVEKQQREDRDAKRGAPKQNHPRM